MKHNINVKVSQLRIYFLGILALKPHIMNNILLSPKVYSQKISMMSMLCFQISHLFYVVLLANLLGACLSFNRKYMYLITSQFYMSFIERFLAESVSSN